MAKIELTLPARRDAAREARRALDQATWDIPDRTVEDLKLLVSELVTNSVRHAGLPAEATIDLKVDVTRERIRVEVIDDGDGFVPDVPQPSLYRSSGWGLFFVGEIADRWGVETNGRTRVWFEMDCVS